MAITTVTKTRITVTEEGVIEVTMSRIFTDDSDGTVAASSRNLAFPPDTDITTLPGAKLKKIANAVWDQATIDAWKAAHPAGGFQT